MENEIDDIDENVGGLEPKDEELKVPYCDFGSPESMESFENMVQKLAPIFRRAIAKLHGNTAQ